MVMTKPLYKTRFYTEGRVLSPGDPARGEVHASLSRLTALLPAGLDPERDIDVVYVAGNLAVAGVSNANDDGVTFDDMLAIYPRFEYRLVDIEHNRKQLVGCIVKAGLSEIGTDRLITPDEARAAGVPFNVAIVMVIWKAAPQGRDLCEFILENASLQGADSDKLSLSFEVGFDDYSVALLPHTTAELSKAAKVIPSSDPSFESYSNLLRVNKGSGRVGRTKERVVRVLGGNLVPLGAGIVTVPAAAVKGIIPITANPNAAPSDETDASNGYSYSSTQLTFPAEAAQRYMVFGGEIPDEHLYTGEDGKTDSYGPGYGRESSPHCTVLYGIVGDQSASVMEAMREMGPITVTMGRVTSFERDDKPYSVLKVDVDSPELHQLNAALRSCTDHESEYPLFAPHCTIAYLRKGLANQYVGDNRFEGHQVTFNSLTWSPAEGDKRELPFKGADPVYSSTTAMSTHRVKLPIGLAAKTKQLNWPKAKVTLSDGRVIEGVTVYNGEELELDKSISMEGVVITGIDTMTPQVPPQIDDSPVIHPHIGQAFPTETPEKRAENAKHAAEKHTAQNMPYTDAALASAVEAACASLESLRRIIAAQSGVSPSVATASVNDQSPSPMQIDLNKLKDQVKSATKIEEVTEAFANVALFADEIAKASEKHVIETKAAKDAQKAAEATAETIRTELAEAKKTLQELKAAQAALAAQTAFDERMTSVAAHFALTDEVRAFIVDDVRACADTAAFEKWFARAKVTMKGYVKAGAQDVHSADVTPVPGSGTQGVQSKDGKDTVQSVPGDANAAKDKKDDGKDEPDEDDACAADKAAIASAVKNPVDKLDLDIVGDAGKKKETLAQQMQRAFAEGISVGGKKVSDLLKQ